MIEHHGVKGMKWGVRRKKNLYSKYSDKDYHLKKGTELKRVSMTNETKLRNGTYASSLSNDNKRYIGEIGTRNRSYNKPSYQIAMKAMSDLKSPSRRKRAQIFMEVYKKDPRTIAQAVAEHKKANSLIFNKNVEKNTNKMLKMNDRKLLKNGYRDFSASLIDSKHNQNAFYSAIKKKGYNMVIDDNDAGTLSRAPVIVINSVKDLKITGSRKITTKEIDKNYFDMYGWGNKLKLDPKID